MVIVAATNNHNKIIELKRILKPLGIDVITAKQAGVDLGEIAETGKSFEENAKIKAITTCNMTGLPAIGDDSGLMVFAINGEPGIYSARYAGEGATDEDKYNLILKKLKDVPEEKRGAKFVTAIHCSFPDKQNAIAVIGECSGNIAFEAKGDNGFGYDPIFLPDQYSGEKSFAQLTGIEKDKISHRGKALRQFVEKLNLILKEEGES